ncbi:hypothetical protein FSP39_016398 [Pinctada imbricata]|uniref:Uncharacterized protein n=1 Tax=Pinctada imbricata TaxID=66713 RepID=A0AA89BZB0_PINIB|nr:hypothetical protein FSP39_016398 [Pinctada imbricata]
MANPTPVLPEYVEDTMPPPSYEEVMGHQIQSSVKHDMPQEELPPLSYIDIMPRVMTLADMRRKIAPVCDSFSVIIQAANQWLLSNPKYGVWKCETVERKIKPDGSIDLDQMVYHESTYGFNVYIRGLRLWLIKKEESGPPQQLGLMNVVPRVKSVEIPHIGMPYGKRGAFRNGVPIFLSLNYPHFYGNMAMGMMRMFETFEGLEETIKRLNEDLEKYPIQGSVLNIESAVIKTGNGIQSGLHVDADSTVFAEEGKARRRYAHILRLFYLIGQPAHEQICLKEFVPDVTKQPTISIPGQFQDQDLCMTRIANWIPHQTGIRVVNIQSYDVRYSESWGEFRIDTDSCDDFDSGMTDRMYLRTIRVFYVISSRVSPPAPVGFLSSKTFLPVRTGRRSFETMAQTMYRIEAWLKVTGLPIFSVETVRFLLKESSASGADLSKSHYLCLKGVGLHFVTAIRVYFPYPYQEPHPSFLPAVPQYMSGKPSETCAIL